MVQNVWETCIFDSRRHRLRVETVNVTEKTLTLIRELLDEDKLLTLLHSMIRDSIRMCTNDEYICTSNPLLFRGNTFRGNELL